MALQLITGTWTNRRGRLTVQSLAVGVDAVFDNRSEVYTRDADNSGNIAGGGTFWAHISSKPIGGHIAGEQIVIYYPAEAKYVLPVTIGMLVSVPKGGGMEGELT